MGDLFRKLYIDSEIDRLRTAMEARMGAADDKIAEVKRSWEAFASAQLDFNAAQKQAIEDLRRQLEEQGVSTESLTALDDLDRAIDSAKDALGETAPEPEA
ncbi:hypothetical protein B7486_63800 [cyanobacterium TDX16]|nr:hypothetical protein B7486_63800 [cyanobacterium TDX16]